MTNNVIKSIREYHDLGLKPLPLKPDCKKPLYKKWSDYSWEVAERATATTPNFGLVMGYGWVTLDLDIKNNLNGFERLRQFDCYEPLPDTARARTSNGGYHYLFRTSVPMPCRIDLGKNFANDKTCIDVRGERWDGHQWRRGYIAVEPTRFGEKSYKWEIHPREVIADIPEWLGAAILKGPAYAKGSQHDDCPKNRHSLMGGHALKLDRRGNIDELTNELIERFPIEGSGQRLMKLSAATGSLIGRRFEEFIIQEVIWRWWDYFYRQGTTRTAPQRIAVKNYASENFKQRTNPDEHRKNIESLSIDEKILPTLLTKLNTNIKHTTSKPKYKVGRNDLLALKSLITYFCYEVQCKGIDPERVPAVSSQIRAIAERLSGKPIDENNFNKNLNQWISKPEKPAAKIELVDRIEVGNSGGKPSVYRCTGVIELFAAVIVQDAPESHDSIPDL